MFKITNEEEQLIGIDNRNSLLGHRNEVLKFILSISEARIAEATKELDEAQYLLDHAEGIDDESANVARVRFADAGLAIKQVIIPLRDQFAKRSLEVGARRQFARCAAATTQTVGIYRVGIRCRPNTRRSLAKSKRHSAIEDFSALNNR